MGFQLIEQDTAVLPTELLPAMKRHGRIAYDDDDETIKEKLAQSIDRIQTRGNFRIVPSKYRWTPGQGEFCNSLARVPYPPVRTCTVTGVTNPADYEVDLRALDGVPITYLVGPFVAGMAVEIETGFLTADDLPPSLTDAIERVAAHLYENREILVQGSDFVSPDFAQDLTWWLPRA
jgi:hypothetical protein